MEKECINVHRMIIRNATRCFKHLDSTLMINVFMEIIIYFYMLIKLGAFTDVNFAGFKSKHEMLLKRNELKEKLRVVDVPDKELRIKECMIWYDGLNQSMAEEKLMVMLKSHVGDLRNYYYRK